MRPILINRALEVGSATRAGGRWILDHLSVATILVAAASSGLEDSPFVKFVVDWGDGTVETSDLLPVDHNVAYTHAYNQQGEYFIRIKAVNSSGEVSLAAPTDTASIRVSPPTERQLVLRRWGGLGLPATKLSTAVVATTEAFPSVTCRLAVDFIEDSFEMLVAGGQEFSPNAEVTITEPQKRLTFARIVKNLGQGRLLLDYPAQATYSKAGAVVEIRQRFHSREREMVDVVDPAWSFPTTYDLDLVRSSLILNLGTRLGERLMKPWVGSRLPELVFEQDSPLLDQIAAAYAEDAIGFEPRVAIASTRVVTNSDGSRRIVVNSSLANASEQVFEASIPLSQ